ncbi:MAG: IMPACT family protein [Deltaproteobacteria bacterium]|nr:IMPACT family protein [Deltaproteobacteria bacterium]
MATTPTRPERFEPPPIKGSRFIASVAPVVDEASARVFVHQLREQMPDASHHCWALRLATPALERAVDDGEPGGSAGRPILSAIVGRDVVDVCVVVTRYFGGTKLGVGGLVRAYGGAAAAVLDRTPTVPRVQTEPWVVTLGYEDGPAVERALQRLGIPNGEVEYGQQILYRLTVPVADGDAVAQALGDATAGRATLHRPR